MLMSLMIVPGNMRPTNKCNLLLISVVVLALFSSIVGQASGSTATFDFGGVLTQVGGPNGLAVDDAFTGTFSYTVEQVGIPVSGGGTQYSLESFSLTILGQTASATGANAIIYNDNPVLLSDRFRLNADPATTGAIVTGAINGAPASQLYLALVGHGNFPFINESLPTALNLEDFPDLRRVDLIFSPGNGAVIGQITAVSVVPLPGAVWLFISGLGSLALFCVGKKKKLSLLG